MLVCQCRGTTDRQIRRLVRDGACSTRDVVQATGAGRDCGGCRSEVKKVVGLAVESVARREMQASAETSLFDKTIALAQSFARPVEG